MLSRNHFYWNMLKKYAIAFGHIFSDIHVLRTASDGSLFKDITVPLTYAGKRKMFSIIQRNPTISEKVSVVLPRISYLITNMTPDSSRKLNPTDSISISIGDTIEDFLYTPIPYNFNIELVIWTKNMDDMLQIVEQSVTFFNPHYTLTVKEIEELDIERNIPVILNSTDFEIDSEIGEEDFRTIMANMNFTLKGFLYPPISDSAVINLINTKLIDDNDNAYSNIKQEYNFNTEEIDETKTEGSNAEWPEWLDIDGLELDSTLDKFKLED